MITNAIDLTSTAQQIVAQNISALSHEPGSSLLARPASEIISAIKEGIIFVKIINEHIVFAVAFEPTGHNKFIEVGMTCNLAQDQVRGKDVFPEIIAYYRTHNGNGDHTLYLTTNDVRMIEVAQSSGFKRIFNIHTAFPSHVVQFCCTPCRPEKTGVQNFGDQIKNCPRFLGEFIPQEGSNLTRMPCMIFAQNLN